nr:immunoglobulin light chain junction region [Macaca mulatta]MOV34931.1 immunoglobulin light chain junction region [Macaca mulatta]
CMQGLQFPYSF